MTQEQSAPPAPPQPTAEHEKLLEHVGEWNVDCTFFMDPSQPPMNVKGKNKVKAFGQFWTLGNFECEMFGAPFRGHCTLGFDPELGKYISTWVDTMSPNFFHFTGNYDASGKALEMGGEGFDCSSGKMTTFRTREEHKTPNEYVFEMFMNTSDGNEIKLFTHVYTRA